jgi:hypothetical protein
MYIYYVLRGTRSDKPVELEGDIDEATFPGIDLGDGRAVLSYLTQNLESQVGALWEEAELTDSFFNREDSFIYFNDRWMRRSDAPWRKDRNN